MSVFNGLSDTIVAQYNKFDPELKIETVIGKSFFLDSLTMKKITSTDGVSHCFGNIEEEALLTHESQQYLATIKGVDNGYISVSNLRNAIIDGEYQNNEDFFALFGAGVAYYLSLGINDYVSPVSVYTPKRGKIDILNPTNAFSMTHLTPTAIFSLQQEFDVKYIVIPIEEARKLMEYEENEFSNIGIYTDSTESTQNIKIALKKMLGDNFTVKDRFEQQEMMYKIMKSEKWAIFLILSFILSIAAFNIVSSMTMLIVEKQQDISILKSFGATSNFIKWIFTIEGLLISLIGTVSGMIIGTMVCYIQKIFKVIKLQGEGSFIIDAYPISINPYDFIFIFITIMTISLILVLYSIQRLKSKNIIDNLK